MTANFELDPVQWATLRGLLDSALALAPEQRSTWVEQLAPEHALLKQRLRDLLAHAADGTGASPLDTLPKVETAQFLGGRGGDEAEQAGDLVGPYRLLRPLGEGGMGTVWLAERTDMLQKRAVALKLPRAAWRGARLAQRLAREREILAPLNHPNIARLYDAGIAADGQPYLALEYVEGERIDAYCMRKQLDVPGRLRLFLQVARAVAHAHANLVVHRDLKPTNILVTEAGEVKLLDFGIAKLLEDGGNGETELTQLGGRALTPDYAAPEQILGHPLATSADVYSLGVVLYELLTGTRPYKLKRDSRAALEEAIVQAESPAPSTAVTDARRARRLRGDLDTIVAKTLKKLPADRYGTVQALAEDIQRHLDGRAVQAQPDSALYRLHKFVARNRLAVGAAASVLLAILIGAGAATWQAGIAVREQARAERVKAFIASIFSDADPYAGSGGAAVTAVDLLKRASMRLQNELADQPEVRAELLRVLGKSYAGLFDQGNAESALTEAVAQTRKLPPSSERDRALADVLVGLGEVKKHLGKPAEARTLLQEALALLAQRGAQRSDVYVDAKLLEAGLALNVGDHDAMSAAAEDAVRTSSALHGEVNPRAAIGYGLLARGRSATAADQQRSLQAAEKSYSILRALYGAQGKPNPAVMDAQHSFGVALIGVGDLSSAAPHIEQSYRDAKALYGEANAMVGHFGARLGQLQILRGDLAAGIRTVRNALAVLATVDANTNMASAGRLRALALGLLWAHRPAEAIEPLVQSAAILKERADPRAALVAQADHALALVEVGRVKEADVLLRNVDAQASALQPPERPLRALARLHLAQGSPEKARPLLEEALQRASTGTRRFFFADILLDLARADLAVGAHESAVPHLQGALQELERTQVRSTPNHASAWMLQARVRLAANQPKEALPLLERADAFWRDFDPDNRSAGEVAFWFARCLEALGAKAQARERYQRASQLLGRSGLPSDPSLFRARRAL